MYRRIAFLSQRRVSGVLESSSSFAYLVKVKAKSKGNKKEKTIGRFATYEGINAQFGV